MKIHFCQNSIRRNFGEKLNKIKFSGKFIRINCGERRSKSTQVNKIDQKEFLLKFDQNHFQSEN